MARNEPLPIEVAERFYKEKREWLNPALGALKRGKKFPIPSGVKDWDSGVRSQSQHNPAHAVTSPGANTISIVSIRHAFCRGKEPGSVVALLILGRKGNQPKGTGGRERTTGPEKGSPTCAPVAPFKGGIWEVI